MKDNYPTTDIVYKCLCKWLHIILIFKMNISKLFYRSVNEFCLKYYAHIDINIHMKSEKKTGNQKSFKMKLKKGFKPIFSFLELSNRVFHVVNNINCNFERLLHCTILNLIFLENCSGRVFVS